MPNQRTNQKQKDAPSAAQFAALRGRVKKLENWKAEIEEWAEKLEPPDTHPDSDPGGNGTQPEEAEIDKKLRQLQEAKDASGRFGRFRGLVKRHPFFWTTACLMLGFILGCIFCDFNTFGGY